jgi:V8-like Glu-specific endopeptidase
MMFRLIAFLMLFSSSAYALPLTQGAAPEISPFFFADTYDYEGIVALSNCSGSLVQLENGKDSDQALILTNGHCLGWIGGFLKPDQVVANYPQTREFKLLSSNAVVIGKVNATHILYATMTGTDMAIYKLQETYADIKAKFNTRPLTLASTRAKASTAIEILSGYWKRGYTCAIESFIPELKEDKWIWKDSIRYSRPGCETIGGTSGSPILEAGTKNVIGVNNTGNESGQECTMNNPCEVSLDGTISFTQGVSYGQQTYWLYSCLDESNNLDLQKSGCLLPK